MSEPVQTCKLCGRQVVVTPDGRGFPPDIAKRKLRKLCKEHGCPCDPQYTAGIDPALLRQLGSGSFARKDEKRWP